MTSIAVIATNPVKLGYLVVKNSGRQGDVKFEKALGRS
jgi:hypothetical protein